MKNILIPQFLFVLITLLSWSCAPTTGDVIEDKNGNNNGDPTVKDEGPCVTWNNKPHEEYAIEQHVIYRDFLRRENYAEAYKEWKKVFELAPAADGQRATHYTDGVKMYGYFLEKEDLEVNKKMWLDSILSMYDKMGVCYHDASHIAGLKAFELYYNYRGLVEDSVILGFFKQAIDQPSDESKVFIMNPFAALLVEKGLNEEVPQDVLREYAGKINRELQLGLRDCEGDCADWEVVGGYVPAQIERLESIRGMFDCDYYRDKYYPMYLSDSTNCEVIEEVYIRMNWGGCDKAGLAMTKVGNAAKKHCTLTSRSETLTKANEALREGRYNEAISLYEKYIANETDDPERKGKIKLQIANIYYSYLKNFPKAREAALQAARFQSGWGDPYILIGTLYASSGPLCGTGRGWDSQVVVWPAIDMWNRAKSIDGRTSAKANNLINKYNQYMPTVGDIFQRNLQEGQDYFVPCWIQETTKIRASR